MRAHELQREDTHANRDEQQRKEYGELFSIDPQIEESFHAKSQRSQRPQRRAKFFFASLRSLRLCVKYLFKRRDNHIPADCCSEFFEYCVRDQRRQKPELTTHQLLNINSHILEHPEHLAHFFAAVDFN